MNVKTKKFNFKITISVTGEARIYGDRDGDRHAEIEYDDERLRKILDDTLLGKLEKVVGFRNFRSEGKPQLGGHVLIGFICDMKDYDCGYIRGRKNG